jgi:hypothetical protein
MGTAGNPEGKGRETANSKTSKDINGDGKRAAGKGIAALTAFLYVSAAIISPVQNPPGGKHLLDAARLPKRKIRRGLPQPVSIGYNEKAPQTKQDYPLKERKRTI